jgi:hypothetical protein
VYDEYIDGATPRANPVDESGEPLRPDLGGPPKLDFRGSNLLLIARSWFDWGLSRRLVGSALGLAVIISTFMPPLIWNSNEDVYLSLAYRRFAPEMFTSNSAVYDSSNARFLGLYFMGAVVNFFGYENAHTLLRGLMAVAYGISFAYLFSVVRLTLGEGAIVICLYQLLGPDLMGGEWLFDGVETKTWAYASVVLALAFVMQDRWKLAAAGAVLATYLHFLVGAFWTVVLLFIHFNLHRQVWKTVSFASLYAVCVLPLLIIILGERASSSPGQSTDGLTADYIYSIIRNPHHAAPFKNFWVGKGRWAAGTVATAVMMLISFSFFRVLRSPAARTVLLSIAGVCVYLLLALIASYFDRHTGTLGKFILFRPSSLALLLFLMSAMLYLKQEMGATLPRRVATTGMLLVAVILVCNTAWRSVDRTRGKLAKEHRTIAQLEPVLSYSRFFMPPDAVVLIDPQLDELTSLPRILRQPTLVGWFFNPNLPTEVIKWYELLKFRASIFSNGCVGSMKYRVDYILVPSSEDAARLSSCGQRVLTSGTYTLIKVDEKLRWRGLG